MRIRITLDQDVYEAAMDLSRTSGQSLGTVLSELAREGLKAKKGRFPVFEVPAGSPMILASRVARFLEEDPF
jgi:hypothetical protein